MPHFESLFRDGMTWENYGRKQKKGWDIEHKRPIKIFNFSSYEDKEFKECWTINNLQPMWHEENMRKGAKII